MTKADSRVPVISSADEFSIPWQTLQTIIAGRSLIDTLELQVANLDEARRFLRAYGLGNGLVDRDDLERLRRIALEYIETVLLADSELCLPQALRELSLAQLLVDGLDPTPNCGLRVVLRDPQGLPCCRACTVDA
jgi:hypothetical protein